MRPDSGVSSSRKSADGGSQGRGILCILSVGEKRTGWQDDKMGCGKVGKGNGGGKSSCESWHPVRGSEEDRMAGGQDGVWEGGKGKRWRKVIL
jgi:hypothetical protein